MKKTGLGSSAALTTSLVASLLSYFGVINLPHRKDYPEKPSENLKSELLLVHNLSQFCHCLAQGKIGSGFDVSAAVFGSQKYIRFSKDFLSKVLEEEATSYDVIETCKNVWDNQVIPFSLPKGMSLILGDVSKGSNTPGMVAKILQWKANHPEGNYFDEFFRSFTRFADSISSFFGSRIEYE